MKEEELEDLKGNEAYVLSPKLKGCYKERTFLLRSGELVSGCISALGKATVVFRVNRDDDTYLGIGVFHQRDA